MSAGSVRIVSVVVTLSWAMLLSACASPAPEMRSAAWERNAAIVGEGNPARSN